MLKKIKKLKLYCDEKEEGFNYPPVQDIYEKINEIIEQVNLLNKNVKRKRKE